MLPFGVVFLKTCIMVCYCGSTVSQWASTFVIMKH